MLWNSLAGLRGHGAIVSAWDPALRTLPDELGREIALESSAEAALRGADATVVMTECPEFRSLAAADLIRWTATPLVLDPGRYLESQLAADRGIDYRSVGRSG